MKTVKILRSTVHNKRDLSAGNVYDLEDKEANLLIALGKATKVQNEADITINQEDKTKPIQQMNKAELLEYCEKIGVEADDSLTKAQIIEAIQSFEDQE